MPPKNDLPEWGKSFLDYLWNQSDYTVEAALTHTFGDDWRGYLMIKSSHNDDYPWECRECAVNCVPS